ncbi:glycoside hydrolase family 88 protein, partial [Salmonella enterica]|nr:glycoside hydrolase family 88 protein [Salmonella enterica]
MRTAHTLMLTMAALATAMTTSCNQAASGNAGEATGESWALRMAHSHGIGDFDCNTKHRDSLATTPWDYVGGLVASSVLEAWQQHPGDTALLEAVTGFANLATSADGTEITKNGKPALQPSNIDDLAAARIYFGLYDHAVQTGDTASARRWKTAATTVRDKLKYDHERIGAGLPGEGGFWHKLRYPTQMWLDGLFMGPAVYARWQAKWGEELGEADNAESWADIALQFKILFEKTYDEGTRLNFHGWSATPDAEDSFWAKKGEPNKGCNAEVWARAMGWYIGALVDVLELMPANHPDREPLLKMFRESASALMERQDSATGLWFNLLRYDGSVAADGKGDVIDGETYNVGTRANYTESSASGMFAYVLLKGSRLGLLGEEAEAAGRRAFEGLIANKITDEGNGKIGIKDICAS